MSTYVIGDVQGCYEELSRLLELIRLDTATDELWLVGDLINRGPDNCSVLDLLMGLSNVQAVLGNHDLHFLAIEAGFQKPHRSDTIKDLLDSPQREAYVDFLLTLPLLHVDRSKNAVLVHAGLPPQLTVDECLRLADEVETCLKSEQRNDFYSAMYGNEPACWNEKLTGMSRLRVITNYFTRIRYCTAEGTMELTHKADVAPDGYAPWFQFPRSDAFAVLFGHWAALEGKSGVEFAIPLDTGCVWGRRLTALRLEDHQFFSVEAT